MFFRSAELNDWVRFSEFIMRTDWRVTPLFGRAVACRRLDFAQVVNGRKNLPDRRWSDYFPTSRSSGKRTTWNSGSETPAVARYIFQLSALLFFDHRKQFICGSRFLIVNHPRPRPPVDDFTAKNGVSTSSQYHMTSPILFLTDLITVSWINGPAHFQCVQRN